MIRFEAVSVTYPDATRPVLRDVELDIPEGELCLVVGRTGSGKSTLLRCINGLVPHFTGGRLTGRVSVDGRDTRVFPPRELADTVGFVGQDPLTGFVTDIVEDELAYGMESLGVAPHVMRRRVEETLDLLGLADVRDRPLLSLSAGQQQRVAIGSVLTVHPRVLVLDEPTSALDPAAAEDVLSALTRLVHDLGMTVVLAEHRLERVVQYADRVVFVPGQGRPIESGPPAELLAHTPVAPPVVELGRLAGWSPLPLSVRDARRAAGPLRARLAGATPPTRSSGRRSSVAEMRGVTAAYGDVLALRGVDLTVHRGEVLAVMGRNGAGKSTLLSVLAGLRQPSAGVVSVVGAPTHDRPARDVIRRVGLVPHEPTDLLWAQSVDVECAEADKDARVESGRTRRVLAELAPEVDGDMHPRDLSEGQRLSLALAIVLASAPPLVLLDEPTRGLDYPAKHRLVGILRDLTSRDHGVVLATHDVELAAELADRIVVMAEGEVVADGPAGEVAVASPVFAPQVAKVLAPLPWLTVGEVAAAIAG
ncbi:MAG: energy-coupling factor transport system ATP-binding protein [Frankiaceae bacterium]|nr:energy-coupling factor transport system ATP-binding protein [Frankiaceae bacterium]